MFWVWIIPVVLAGVSVAVAAVIVIRKMPQLGVMDTSTAVGAREKRVKEAIILERFDRMGKTKLGKVSSAAQAAARGVSKTGRRAVQRLYALEQYYQRLKKSSTPSSIDADTVRTLLDQAEEFVKEEEYVQAEKRYIEVISHNPKMAEAYEGLGNLYLHSGQYGQAREALKFALRLSPADASVNMSLAEVDLAEEKPAEALVYLRLCIEKRPNNPKYLDTYIEAALDAKSFDDAQKGLAQLKQANPENQKIEEFEERVQALKPKEETAGDAASSQDE